MSRRAFVCLILALIALSHGLATRLLAAKPVPTYTTIQVTDMHCPTCAKKIAARLYTLPGVLEVRANVEADKAYVRPQKQRRPSPRAMWEAVENAGFKVVMISGPDGQFRAKPKK